MYSIVGCFLYLQYNIPEKFCQVFHFRSVYSGAFAGILFSLFSAVQILIRKRLNATEIYDGVWYYFVQ